ncbi:MAG: ATP synthase F1 subunit gamma [Candidatus Omnitrophica bacterium]|nr:ATP synthase F1 subunit gamma [Candidatus Omnitrophota bacterium]
MNLRDVRRRLKSVENTRKITRAMEMVAGAKLKQLESALSRARPYIEGLQSLLSRLLAEYPGQHHSLFEKREGTGHTGLILITSDTGLCGSYNSDLVAEAERWFETKPADKAELLTVGLFGHNYCLARGLKPHASFTDFKSRADQGAVQRLLESVVGLFTGGGAVSIEVISCYFRSAASWGPRRMRLLPLEVGRDAKPNPYPTLLEPGAKEVFEALVPRVLEGVLRQALLEAFSAEQSARMMAMRNATDNADDMVKELTLTRNKVRQAQITKEIIEVVSGAEGLKS